MVRSLPPPAKPPEARRQPENKRVRQTRPETLPQSARPSARTPRHRHDDDYAHGRASPSDSASSAPVMSMCVGSHSYSGGSPGRPAPTARAAVTSRSHTPASPRTPARVTSARITPLRPHPSATTRWGGRTQTNGRWSPGCCSSCSAVSAWAASAPDTLASAWRNLWSRWLPVAFGGLWELIDGILILGNGGTDAQGRPLRDS